MMASRILLFAGVAAPAAFGRRVSALPDRQKTKEHVLFGQATAQTGRSVEFGTIICDNLYEKGRGTE